MNTDIEYCLAVFQGLDRKPSANRLNLTKTNADLCYHRGDWTKPQFQNKLNPSCLYQFINLSDLGSLPSSDHHRICLNPSITIDSFYHRATELWSGSDLLIYQIQPSSLLPPITNCFDIYVKPPSIYPLIIPSLTNLTIIFRHSNRYPLRNIPSLDNLLYLDPTPEPGSLTPQGLDAAYQFGQNLSQTYTYNLDSVISQTICISSPSERCIQTLAQTMNGLQVTQIIQSDPRFKTKLKLDTGLIETTETIRELGQRANDVVRRTSQICHLSYMNLDPIRALFVSGKLVQRLIVYEDLGLSIDSFLGSDLWLELRTIAGISHNLIQYWTCLQNQDRVERWFEILTKLHTQSSLVLCCTHDTVLSIMIQYLRIQTNYRDNLQYPGYLANIRIEHWSDGTRRIFYNNTQLQ